MGRRAPKKRPNAKAQRSHMPSRLAVGAVCLVATLAVAGFGFGLASADRTPESSVEFGLSASSSATSSVGQLTVQDTSTSSSQAASHAAVSFDVDGAAAKVEERQAAELAQQKAAELAAENASREKALSAEATWRAASDRPTGLEEVDWSVSRDEFIATWGARIDKFLEGSNLAGYGATFAEAAWDNGIDPRFSAAICNTESGRGQVCFRPYNAWGWGQIDWTSWDEAIRAHAQGLAEGYGYGLTLSGAYKYCWDNYTNWYSMTLYGFEHI